MKWRDWIGQNPAVLVGKPVAKGTRISVELILERLSAGATERELLDSYPTLRPEHIRAALQFAGLLLRRSKIRIRGQS